MGGMNPLLTMFLHARERKAALRLDSLELKMDSLRQPTRSRTLSGAENILRIGRGEQPAPNPALREGELSRKGQAALDLVSQVADTINATENRIEMLLVRALEQLKQMEERNRALEERAAQAEARAREAEKWLMRLHVEMEDKFVSWKGAQARNLAGSAAA
jgi:hypothetical protein